MGDSQSEDKTEVHDGPSSPAQTENIDMHTSREVRESCCQQNTIVCSEQCSTHVNSNQATLVVNTD